MTDDRPALLQIDGLRHAWPGQPPLFDGLSLRLPAGLVRLELEVGKTTLLALLAGRIRPAAGQMLWQGQDWTPGTGTHAGGSAPSPRRPLSPPTAPTSPTSLASPTSRASLASPASPTSPSQAAPSAPSAPHVPPSPPYPERGPVDICHPDARDPALDALTPAGLWAAGAGHPRQDPALWQALVAAFGLDAHAHKTLAMLSTGWRRKAVLCAALARHAALTLLDEPTAGLDGPALDVLARALEDAAALARREDRLLVLTADWGLEARLPSARVVAV